MGLELAEQSAWQLPDVILYPTGGGTGLICMWKAFQELREIGWLNTGAVQKYIEVIQTELPRIDLNLPVDWEFLTDDTARG